jgi:hypothetical protein
LGNLVGGVVHVGLSKDRWPWPGPAPPATRFGRGAPASRPRRSKAIETP